jgi:hypothetical protein
MLMSAAPLIAAGAANMALAVPPQIPPLTKMAAKAAIDLLLTALSPAP